MPAASRTPALWRRIRAAFAGDAPRDIRKLADETQALKQDRAVLERKIDRLGRELAKYKESSRYARSSLDAFPSSVGQCRSPYGIGQDGLSGQVLFGLNNFRSACLAASHLDLRDAARTAKEAE